MDPAADRSWSCYPEGLLPTRCAFLQTLAAAAAVAGAPWPSEALSQDCTPGDEPIPAFPAAGFPEGSVRLNFNENPLGPSKKVITALIDNGLVQLRTGLKELGFDPYPHRAPFFMVDFGRPTYGMVRALFNKRIFVQPGSNWGMPNFMRVSVGTTQDNEAFLEAIREIAAPRPGRR